ncbi:MAG: hypothetical protein RIF41_19065 [Polyangiaceae bacterium]
MCGSILLWSSTAGAQYPDQGATSFHGTGEVVVSYDDNIRNEATDPLRDVSLTIAPGVLLLHRMERGALSVRYQRPFVFFLINSQISSSADIGSLDFAYALTDVDDFGITVGATRAATNLIGLGPTAGVAGGQPPAPVQLVTPSLAQRYGHAFDERWSLGQSSTFAFTTPIGENTAFSTLASATVGMGPRLQLERHAFGLEGSFTYNYVSAIPGLEGSVDFHQLMPAATGDWSWQFAERWQQQVAVGAAVPITPDGNLTVAPLATLTTLYTQREFGAALTFSQAVTPNLQTQQIFLTDTATLSAFMPLVPNERLIVDGATSISHNRLFARDLTTDSARATSWSFDLGLSWSPLDLPLALTARYQHFRQFLSNEPMLQEFERNVVSLGIGTILPPIDPVMQRRGTFQPAGASTPGGPLPSRGEDAGE